MRQGPMHLVVWAREVMMVLRWLVAVAHHYPFWYGVGVARGVVLRTTADVLNVPVFTILSFGVAPTLPRLVERPLDLGDLHAFCRSPVRDRSRVIAVY